MKTLYVVATPIGNLEDITIRAIKILLECPVIACEDTRHTGVLINLLKDRFSGIFNFQFPISKQKYLSVRDWNEAEMVEKVLQELETNDVAMLSDAGTPLISDPGFKVVRAARAAGVKVVPIPGANAAVTALSAAGLPSNRFVFWGFWNNKYKLLSEATNIIYESPERAEKTCQLIKEKHPNANIVIAKELTKIHEEYLNYEAGIMNNAKGEITLLVYLPAGRQALPNEIAANHGNGNGDLKK